jgi:hypothetical protein
MNITEKKEILIDIVKDADEKLIRLLFALADEFNDPSFEFTKGELEGFYEVRDELLKHPETGYTVEEAHRLIRNKI